MMLGAIEYLAKEKKKQPRNHHTSNKLSTNLLQPLDKFEKPSWICITYENT